MILIIDDDKTIRLSLRLLLSRAGYQTAEAAGREEALDAVRKQDFDLILMDMNYSRATNGEEGLHLLRQVRIFRPDTPVILMTAWGSIELAVEGMRLGAFDFITKPFVNRDLLQRIATGITLRKEENIAIDKGFDRAGIIGENPELKRILSTVERVAHTDAPVLILGENGTGKELIAEAIHANSRRKQNPFVKVNLGGVSQSLFESEMFGHVKGAFTGAVASRKGSFELADTGSIFLDEIGDLGPSEQVKMLRVLQEHTFQPLGDSRIRKVDIRIVCATNADLDRMVRERTFREDLFYRINLITLKLPPLRERRDDIPILVRHFISNYARKTGMEIPEISSDAMTLLCRLPYPGNIRELKNLVERSILVNTSGIISADDIMVTEISEPPVPTSENITSGTLEEVERRAISDALKRYGGNLSKAALALGVTRQSLYRRIEKLNLRPAVDIDDNTLRGRVTK